MATPTDENFTDYKKAERKALELLREMKAVSAKKTDIELALLVAIFELHKATLPAATIAAIVHGQHQAAVAALCGEAAGVRELTWVRLPEILAGELAALRRVFLQLDQVPVGILDPGLGANCRCRSCGRSR